MRFQRSVMVKRDFAPFVGAADRKHDREDNRCRHQGQWEVRLDVKCEAHKRRRDAKGDNQKCAIADD